MNVRKKSMKQEKENADIFGGKCQPGSGACWGAKGDVICDEYLIEAKYTDADSYSFSPKTWDKIENEAYRADLRIPLIQLNIKDLSLIIFNSSLIPYTSPLYMAYSGSYLPRGNSITIKYNDCVKNIDTCFKDGKLWMHRIVFAGSNKVFYMMQREDFKLFIDNVC